MFRLGTISGIKLFFLYVQPICWGEMKKKKEGKAIPVTGREGP
jgi:hypothetical protein